MNPNTSKLMAINSGQDGDPRIFSKPIAYSHSFYLTGPIEEAEQYLEWFDIIRNAGERDEIDIYINSGGGLTDTALQFIKAIQDSSALIHCSVEGSCMSAATMIFLAGDAMSVAPNSLFMFHNYSGGSVGKGGELYDNIVFEREWSKAFMLQIYEGFLTKEEILSMLDNKDIWLSSDQVMDRLNKLVEFRQAKHNAKVEAGN